MHFYKSAKIEPILSRVKELKYHEARLPEKQQTPRGDSIDQSSRSALPRATPGPNRLVCLVR